MALAPGTKAPAAVLDTCVPCALSSMGRTGSSTPFHFHLADSKKERAPMSLLLQTEVLKSQRPFHLAGGGGMPVPSKDGWAPAMPPSRTPMMIPSPMLLLFQTPAWNRLGPVR